MLIENTCKTCDLTKSISNFYKSTRTLSGYRNTCKQCCANKAAKRYDKTKVFVGHNQSNLPLPSQEWLKDNFDYHPDGYFIRKISRGRSGVGSSVKGKLEKNGYYRVSINYSTLLLHRLIWKWHYGTEPEFLDHEDKVRTNCRIGNLRIATKNENARNQNLPINNTSGFIGVSFYRHSSTDKWCASISFDGEKNCLYFYSLLDAVLQYNAWALEIHGEYAKDKIQHNLDELERRGLLKQPT